MFAQRVDIQEEYKNNQREEGKMDFETGQIIKLKKQHPCGTNAWEIIRTGADFRLRCTGCGHQVMLARKLVEKNFKGFTENA